MGREAHGLRRYGPLLRAPRARQLALASFVARSCELGLGVTLLLAVRSATGSFGLAGTAAGLATAVGAASRVAQGRLIDRVGPVRVLVPWCGLHLAATLALALATSARAGTATLLILSVALGASIPAVGLLMRILWGLLAPEPDLRTPAHALESMATELSAMAGPACAGVLAGLLSPASALVLLAAPAVGGTLVLATAGVWRTRAATRDRRTSGSLARTLALPIALMVTIGTAGGIVEVATLAFGSEHASTAAGGLLVAVFAAGSLVGGLWYGSRRWRVRRELRLVVGLAASVLAYATLPLADTVVVLGVLLLVAGVPLAPSFTVLYVMTDSLVPPSRIAEAFAWIGSALPGGVALGSALGGWTVAALGTTVAFGVASAIAACALACAVPRARRGRSVPAFAG